MRGVALSMTIGGTGKRNVNYDLERARKLLAPLVTMFVDAGLTTNELLSLIEELYFHEIRDHYGDDGKPARVTTMALLGGMTRKKVAAILHNRAIRPRESTLKRIAHRWRTREPWSINGTPLLLPLKGEVSFTGLCETVGGLSDARPSAVANLACRLGYLKTVGNDQYQLIEHSSHDDDTTLDLIEVAVAASTLVADRCVKQSGRNIIARRDAVGLAGFIVERVVEIMISSSLN